jgi:hypothetical protein
MTPKQINKLTQQYTKATLEECEEKRLNNLKDYDDDNLEYISFVITEKLEENYLKLMNNDFSEVTEAATNKLCCELLIATDSRTESSKG